MTSQLTHIPSIGPDLPLFSYIGTLNYLLNSKGVINAGVKKVSCCASVAFRKAMLIGFS
jgi:hypothetical protein